MILVVPVLLHVLLMAMLPAAVLSLNAEPECTLVELHRCLESLQSVTQGNDLDLATTKIELLAVCSTLKDSVSCVDDHMEACFSDTQRQVFNHVVAGARQVLAELCVPGPIQEAYLRHSPCFRNVSLSENKCAPKYRHLLHLSENVDGQQHSVDQGLRESCCAFNAFVLCKYLHVGRDCGADAVDFLQRHLDRISNSLIHEHCATYTYATDACSPASRAGTSRDPSALLCLASLMTLAVLFLRDRRNGF